MSSAQDNQRQGPSDEVNRVALRALSSLVSQDSGGLLVRRPLESYLTEMLEAALATRPDALMAVVRHMRRARITSAVIAELYVPAVARRLGEAWVEDRLDFGAVTIGTSRLQSLLRALEKDWTVPAPSVLKATKGLVVGVRAGQQHTLGATIVAGHLRRLGMSVNLDLELTADRLRDHVVNQQLSGVLLSGSACDEVDSLKELVNIVHQECRTTPVIIGGTVLTLKDDILSLTGADFASQDVEEVLRFCEDCHVAHQDDTFALTQDVK